MGEREKGQDRYRQKCNHHSCFNELMLPFRWLWGSTVSPVTIVSPVRGLEMQCWVVGYCVVRQRRESCLATAVHRAWFWQSCCHSPIMVGPWVARRYLTPPPSLLHGRGCPKCFPTWELGALQFTQHTFTTCPTSAWHSAKEASVSEPWCQMRVLIFFSKRFRKATFSKIWHR